MTRCTCRRRSLKAWIFSFLCIGVIGLLVNYVIVERLHAKIGVRELPSVPFYLSNKHGQQHAASMEAVYKQGELGNFEPPSEPVGTGPGQGGQPVKIMKTDLSSVRDYGCDMTVSDMISLDRSIPDTRPRECKFWHYPTNLPSASVVVVFYNEGNSTLLRTVHSIINRSPPSLLKEVVLVDDGSTKDHLKKPLESYIRRFKGLVKLYRNEERLGLIGARMRGAREATGDVFIVLDSHCECNTNWLPPLLHRIALNRRTLVQPTVDVISYNDFAYKNIFYKMVKGVFDWGLLYKEMYGSDEEQAAKWKHNSEPYGTPTHAGGLFAVDRKYFFDIGGYDENLLVWGGENFQLSFKMWMCGGRMEMVPCSRVGHVYHSGMPYSLNINKKRPTKMSVIKHNYLRVVEGWMDEYKEYFYIREPDVRHRAHEVNVTDQLELRKKLGCKSFKWYLDNVAYGILDRFPLPPPNKAWGRIQERNGSQCFVKARTLIIGYCGGAVFRYNTAGQISNGEYCLAYKEKSQVFMFPKCPDGRSHPWDWNQETGLIRHPELNQCLTSAPQVFLSDCDKNNLKQQWVMKAA
ncbi:probable N-acetylgalactosaminyltransferase 7 [Haliotis rubra]|uniref:probable N-acetylgalactosaminyltransferase 7 n=1 Tax=Haliotis rubra TaxID=36100 RepID=UPI001EE51813|nr:probable N-acetylgalactosaminyltransferase 7 [Haliotis rubra]